MLSLALFLLSCAPDEADGGPLVSEAGLYEADVAWTPDPPIAGDVVLGLALRDAATGAPVEGAALVVTPWMPEHGHGVSGEVLVTDEGGGDYAVTFAFSMPGDWEITVEIDAAPGADALVFEVDVG